MSVAVIHSLLDQRLNTIPNLPSTLTENSVFDASSNVPSFIRSTILPARSAVISLGASAGKKLQGLYQVDVFYPSGTGSTAAQTLADTVVATFPIGLILTSGTIQVMVEIASAMPAYDISKYYGVPILIQWSCYVLAP